MSEFQPDIMAPICRPYSLEFVYVIHVERSLRIVVGAKRKDTIIDSQVFYTLCIFSRFMHIF